MLWSEVDGMFLPHPERLPSSPSQSHLSTIHLQASKHTGRYGAGYETFANVHNHLISQCSRTGIYVLGAILIPTRTRVVQHELVVDVGEGLQCYTPSAVPYRMFQPPQAKRERVWLARGALEALGVRLKCPVPFGPPHLRCFIQRMSHGNR